jgi:hypothetical protein
MKWRANIEAIARTNAPYRCRVCQPGDVICVPFEKLLIAPVRLSTRATIAVTRVKASRACPIFMVVGEYRAASARATSQHPRAATGAACATGTIEGRILRRSPTSYAAPSARREKPIEKAAQNERCVAGTWRNIGAFNLSPQTAMAAATSANAESSIKTSGAVA